MSQGGFGGGPPGYGQQGWGQPQAPQPQGQQGWGQPQQPQGWGQPAAPGYGPPPADPGAPPGGGFGGPPGGGFGGPPGGGFGGPPGGGFGGPPGGGFAGSDLRFDSALTGGDFFVLALVNYLLVVVTCGIYTPWALCKVGNAIAEKITMTGSPKGTVRFRFHGDGGALFGKYLVGMILTQVSCGIYFAWFLCDMARWVFDHFEARADDGTTYKAQFTGDGGSYFGLVLVNALLCGVTMYIYIPWAQCKTRKWWLNNLRLLENGQPVGTFDFVGDGGTLFGTFIVGVLLTGITCGIYYSWFECSLTKFNAQNTRINFKGRAYGADYHGQGGDLFVLDLVNGLLTALTGGIYGPWAYAKKLKWSLNQYVVKPIG
jgi:uncharacterized membrane protein YjgN (DUF898 family)